MRMRLAGLILIVLSAFSCNKIIDVSSIDQIPGKWQWESTCGGIEYECEYSSKSNKATIEFTNGGEYVEIHNGTVFLETKYTIQKFDDSMGSLILENPAVSRPITILNNRLLITRGELMDSYYKIK
jgi:hypothetical protein